MIAALKCWLMRELLKSEIRSMESYLVTIAEQRRNDYEVEKIIIGDLAAARRQMQALINNDILAASARRS